MAIPEKFRKLANAVRNEIYGRDVREAIAKSIEMTGESSETAIKITEQLIDGSFDAAELTTEIERKLNELEAEYAPELNGLKTEMSDARGNESSLNDRFNSVDSRLAQADQDIKRRGIDVKQYGAKGDESEGDKEIIQSLINSLSDGDKLIFPSGDYLLTEVNIDTPIDVVGIGQPTIIGDGESDIFKVTKEFSIQGIKFKDARRAIDTTECEEGNLLVDRCDFKSVEFPVYMRDDSVITIADKVEIKNCTMDELVTGVTCRRKRVKEFIVTENRVTNVETDTRFARAFGVGASSDGEILIDNIQIERNFIDGIKNTGDGQDWESQGIMCFGANVVIKNNVIQNLRNVGGTDCEAIYSKGLRVVVNDNILIDAGGDEGVICIKQWGNAPYPEKENTTIIKNNLIEFTKSESETGLTHVGVLVTREGGIIEGNTFKNCYNAIEVYTGGWEGLTAKDNHFENCRAALNLGTTSGEYEGNALISDSTSNNCEFFIRTSSTATINGSITISDNDVSNLITRFFHKRGQIRRITMKNNVIKTVDDYTNFIVEFSDVHPNGEDIIFDNNHIDEMDGRAFVMLDDGEDNYSPYVEINNNTVRKADRGFQIRGEIDLLVATNNQLLNVNSHALSASPTVEYRLNNIGLEDSVPS